jgi:D-alanine transfer protein
MYPGMMNKLYFQSTAKEEYKIAIQEYIKKNIDSIKNPNYLYTTSIETIKEEYFDNKIKEIIINSFDNTNQESIQYQNPGLDYEKLKNEANKIAVVSNNNSFGIQNEYYTKFIEPSIQNGTFPFSIIIPSNLNQNQEYQDFLLLLELLQSYQIKPFFVIEDLHPDIFSKNRDEMTQLIVSIKSKLEEYEYEYFDMWSYEKKEYEIGTLTDMVHIGELGWLKINQKIIDYFMPQRRD